MYLRLKQLSKRDRRVILLGGFALTLLMSGYSEGAGQPAPFDWRSDWSVREGFSLEIDTEGYSFPTAIAFVPEPGRQPKDPLYFVTELRGRVKVVTNDRTVFTFAEKFFRLTVRKELPATEGEIGLAGICLDPDRGYVFVTFAHQDSGGIFRNNIVRFQSLPKTFSLKPSATLSFAEVFSSDVAVPSHQIGHCQTDDGHLYVSVGDGHQPHRSQRLDSTLGKILRMTLDGKPAVDNPFYQKSDVKRSRNYVWAYGFRNPFGMKLVRGRLFVAENGPRVDRFLEVRKGERHLWDGSDWSIGTNAIAVFAPPVSPVQVDYVGEDSTLSQEYRNQFFVAVAADFTNPRVPTKPGVVALKYDLDTRRVLNVPRKFVEYRGQKLQLVVGVALGPDGLYFVPIHSNQEGRSAISRVAYDPPNTHPYIIGRDLDAFALMRDKGCFGCHTIDAQGGTVGPPLDPQDLIPRLQGRLHSEEYLDQVKALDSLDAEPVRRFRGARRNVLDARGLERVRIWMRFKIQAPGFDNPSSQMPNLGVHGGDASRIADYLLAESGRSELAPVQFLRRRLSPLRFKHLLFAFAGGLVAGVSVLPFILFSFRKILRRANRRSTPAQ